MYKVLFNSQTVNEFNTPTEAEDFANAIINNKTDITYNNGSDSVAYEGVNGYYFARFEGDRSDEDMIDN